MLDAVGVVGSLGDHLARDEVKRRLVHAGGAAFPLAYLVGIVTWPQLRTVYAVGLLFALALEFLRVVIGLDWWVFRRLTREYEQGNLAGYALYVIGSTLAVLAFAPRIAVPAVLILSIVDPVSGLLAENEFREPKRPFVLVVTFGLSGLIAGAFVPLSAALLAAGVTTVADGLTPVVRGHVIDDNLTIPIGAGLAMWAVLRLLPS